MYLTEYGQSAYALRKNLPVQKLTDEGKSAYEHVTESGEMIFYRPDPPQSYQFPAHVKYDSDIYRPYPISHTVMDNAVRTAYDEWKTLYLKQPTDQPTHYYIDNDLSDFQDYDPHTTSETHGHGMVIVAYMNGHDANAKTIFDGMFSYFKAHPSGVVSTFMARRQLRNANGQMATPTGDAVSSTTGDMDIAYSLLLADKIWGSAGTINYLQAGKNIINALRANNISTDKLLQLGDWVDNADPKYGRASRPSDFMLSQIIAFRNATQDQSWNEVRDNSITILNSVFTNYSPNTGYMPDYIVYDSALARFKPVVSNLDNIFFESIHDKDYYENACLTPFRFALAQITEGNTGINGDPTQLSLQPMLTKMNEAIRAKASNNPNNIHAGYDIETGNVLDGVSGFSQAFNCPFMISGMISPNNQVWVNNLWNLAVTGSVNFEPMTRPNSIKLLCMIVASTNWWTPRY